MTCQPRILRAAVAAVTGGLQLRSVVDGLRVDVVHAEEEAAREPPPPGQDAGVVDRIRPEGIVVDFADARVGARERAAPGGPQGRIAKRLVHVVAPAQVRALGFHAGDLDGRGRASAVTSTDWVTSPTVIRNSNRAVWSAWSSNSASVTASRGSGPRSARRLLRSASALTPLPPTPAPMARACFRPQPILGSRRGGVNARKPILKNRK